MELLTDIQAITPETQSWKILMGFLSVVSLWSTQGRRTPGRTGCTACCLWVAAPLLLHNPMSTLPSASKNRVCGLMKSAVGITVPFPDVSDNYILRLLKWEIIFETLQSLAIWGLFFFFCKLFSVHCCMCVLLYILKCQQATWLTMR